jgi:hypothetical protein
MKIWLSRRFVVVLSCLVLTYAAQGQGDRSPNAAIQPVNPDAQVQQEFKKRVDAYVDLRNKLKKQSPALKETKNPAEIQVAQEALAAKIREARKAAKPGEIFTAEVRTLFRRLMYPEVRGKEGAETKQAIREDAPKGVPLKVNAKYPEGAPLPTVPPNLLAALPKLPEDLEYRIINRDLILLDVHTNLIVDYIPKAIQ